MSWAHSKRLLVVAAAIELATGICLFAFPSDFSSALYAPIIPLLPRLSAALLGGGLLLLITVRYTPSAPIQRALLLGAVPPLLLFALHIFRSGGYTGAIAYLVLAGGVLAATWSENLDLFSLTLGLIHLIIGPLMLATPYLLGSPAFAPIRPVLPLVGLLSLGGAALLLLPPVRRILPPGWRRVGSVILPAILAYTFGRSGAWTGLVMWLIWGAGSLLDSHPLRTSLQPGSPQVSDDPDEAWAARTERTVESWAWLLTLLVVGITSLLEPTASAALPRAILFVLLVGGYNVIVCWLLPPLGTARLRLTLHLTILAVAVSLLSSSTAQISPALLPVLLAIPMAAARAGGRRWGYGMLGLVLTVMVLSHLYTLWPAQTPLERRLARLAVQVVTLGVTGAMGVSAAAEQRRLFQQVEQTSHSLVQSNEELQAANEELQAQSEELVAQQDELLRQHRALVDQSMVLSSQRDELRESEGRFRTAFESAPIGMALIGLDLVILRANPALHQMLGYPPNELTGMSVRQITHPDDIRSQTPALEAVRVGRSEGYALEKRYLHRDGRIVWVAISVGVVRDAQGSPLYLVSQIMDVTERRMAEQRLRHLANHDSLTDLINRHRFQTVIEAELSRPNGGRGALLFLDFDQFKFINDTLGHQAGDELLKGLARVLEATLGDRGSVARLGGDEFGVLIPGADAAQAEVIAAEVLSAVRSHMEVIGGQQVGITVSIGVALYPDHGSSVEELMLHADLAMYQAKEGGRDRHRIYVPDGLEAEMGSRLNWERRIREALAEERLLLLFQPILDLHTNQVVQYEALLRMAERDGTLIPPGQFLGVAESYGLIHALDRWVVRKAIRTIAEQRKKGRLLTLGVNLSARAFSDPELLPLIQQELAATGVPPESLNFEITETAAIADMELATAFIKTLTGLGCRFALDDFGAGFSSLVQLKRLPVGSLKIDGGFIERLPEDPVDQKMVKAVVTMARELGMQTVAEYVGCERTLSFLRACGVDAAQGYHIGRPGPLPG